MYAIFQSLCDHKGVKPADVARETGIAKATLIVTPNAKKEGSPDGERAQHLGGRTRREKPWEKPPGAYFVSASIVALS